MPRRSYTAAMVEYRRKRVPGGTYFFTVTLQDRSASLLTTHAGLLGEAMRDIRLTHPFETIAIVILPDHLHAVWRLPEGDSDYSTRWRLIKAGFTRQLKIDRIPASERKGRSLWARRFWEHSIRDEEDLRKHVEYVHGNPLKHGLAERMEDWPWSSYRRYALSREK